MVRKIINVFTNVVIVLLVVIILFNVFIVSNNSLVPSTTILTAGSFNVLVSVVVVLAGILSINLDL